MEASIGNIREALQGIVTYQPDSDLLCLYEYAAKVPENGTIVEVGTADGASAIVMAMASKPTVKIFTCDPLKPKNMDAALTRLGLTHKVSYFNGKSSEFNETWPETYLIDLLFIDGMHSYEAVWEDIIQWGTYMRNGGYVLIHDTLYYENTVGKAANEAVERGLLKKIKLLEDDIATINNKPVGMLVTEKLKWDNQ